MPASIQSPLLYALSNCLSDVSSSAKLFPSAQLVNWAGLLPYAEKSLDMMVYFCPAWIEETKEALGQFLSRRSAKVRLVMPDPRNPLILREMKRLFPEHTESMLLTKVVETQAKLNAILGSLPEPRGQLECFLLPRGISYTCRRLDEEVFVYSLIDMYAQHKVNTPTLVGNLRESPELQLFFEKEWNGILREAVRCDLSKILGK